MDNNILDLRSKLHRLSGHRVSEFLPEIAAALRQAGIKRVQLFYYGDLDLGTLHYPIFIHSTNQDSLAIDSRTCAEVHVFFSEVLEMRYPQWANAEGARGEFCWDVQSDTLTHTHEVRTVTYKAMVSTNL
jgi:hypothetical protein